MFVTKNNSKFLTSVILMANSDHLIDFVATKIKETNRFDMCNLSGNELSYLFKDFIKRNTLVVRPYKSKNPFSKALGYFSRSNPKVINVNTRKFYSLKKEFAVSLLFHEAGHAMDNYYPHCNCHHGDNNKLGKENTLQYSINRFVYEYYGVNPTTVEYKLPWYKRFFRWLF